MAPATKRGIVDRLRDIDRRIIFIFVAASVVIPLLYPLGLPLKSSPLSRSLYREIEGLQPGSVVLMAFDYDPATEVELGPMSLAILKHCFRKGHKVVGLALWPQGAGLARATFSEAGADFDVKYGVDYVMEGHYHAYVDIEANGVRYITSGCFSDGLLNGGERHFLLMRVYGPNVSVERIPVGTDIPVEYIDGKI